MKRSLLFVCVVLMAAGLLAGCGGRGGGKVDKEQLAARVEDWTLQSETLEDIIANLPEAQKRKYDTPKGRADLSERLLEEELFHQDALKKNLDQDKDVVEQLEEAKRRVLIQAYYTKYVNPAATPSEQEIHDYYEENADVYTNLAILRAQHIFSEDKDKIEDVKKKIGDKPNRFTNMATQYSEDIVTKGDGGDLGFFNPGGYIRSIGYSDAINKAFESMQPGDMVGPVKWEKGYSLLKLNERRPAELRPYDEVKGEISELLINRKLDEVKARMVRELKKKFSVENYMEERYRAVQRSSEELWNYARSSNDPNIRISTFEEIIEKFPEDKYAPQALFMIGFVYLEELQDDVSAGRIFTRVLEQYPDSDVAESAKWMLENMGKPLPEFEDIDDLNQKLQQQGGDR